MSEFSAGARNFFKRRPVSIHAALRVKPACDCSDGVVFETFDHAYETVADGPWADARGHCIPGSTLDPYAPQYAVACAGWQWTTPLASGTSL